MEEQYYIIWPIALFLLWRFVSRRVATIAIAAGIVLSLASSIFLSGTHAIAAFYLPVTRFWELLFGSALAWVEFHSGEHRTALARDTALAWRLTLRDFASFAGVALIAVSLALFDPKIVFPGWRAALPAGGATLIIAAGPAAWFNRRHLHPEAKFWGADFDQRGFLARRHVYAGAVQPIGKEADRLDDPETVGGNDFEISYDLSQEDRSKLSEVIKDAKKVHGLSRLSKAVRVSHHQVNAIVRGSVVADRILKLP